MKKSRPIKILFPFVGDTFGGSHKSAILLIEYLKRFEYDVQIVIQEDGPLGVELRKRKIAYQVHRFYKQGGSGKSKSVSVRVLVSSIVSVITIMVRLKPTIVHLNDARVQLSWVIPAFLLRIRSVWHQRTILAPSRLTRFLMGFATSIVCISKTVDSSMPASTKAKRSVIPNPIQRVIVPETVVSERREELLESCSHLTPTPYILGFVGNMRTVKRPEIFARVVVDLNLRLKMPCVGAMFGEDREGYESRISEVSEAVGLEKKILFLGFRPNIEEWICACDVLIAPAVGEGFGRGLLEAMMLGVPVIASNSGGHQEIIEHRSSGLLVDPDNVAQFSDSVKHLFSNMNVRTDIIARAKKSASGYSVRNHSELIQKLYLSGFSH